MTRLRFSPLACALLTLVSLFAQTAPAADPPAGAETHRVQLARLLLKRAKLRQASASTSDIRGAIVDAERAITLGGHLAEAYVMLADARYAMALQVSSDRAKLDELEKTIHACSQAEGLADLIDNRTKGRLYLILGSAFVLRANYIRDETFRSQARDLHAAIEAVKKSAALQANDAPDVNPGLPGEGLRFARNLNPSYVPDLALGNAYEDLAWICREDSIKNFSQAIAAFQRAAGNSAVVPAVAVYSSGRCYYKLASDTFLYAKELENQDLIKIRGATDAWRKAEEEITRSLQLDPNNHEALSKLADVYYYRNNYAKGDECLQMAVKLTANDPTTRSMYLLQWGEYCIARARATKDPADFARLRQQAQRCLDDIESIAAGLEPVEDCLDPAKQAAYLSADLKFLGEKPVEGIPKAEDFQDGGALSVLDKALKPLDDSQAEPSSGYSFLLGRRALLRRGYGRRYEATAREKKKKPDPGWEEDTGTAIRWYQSAAGDYQKQAEGARSRHEILTARVFAAETHAEAYIAACKLNVVKAEAGPFPEEPSFRAAIEQLKAADEIWNLRRYADLDRPTADGLYPLITEMLDAKRYIVQNSIRPKQVLTKADVAFAETWFGCWKRWNSENPNDHYPNLDGDLNGLLTSIKNLAP
jgi:hypothetical protein